MFNDIQKQVNDLEDYISQHSRGDKDDVFVLVTHLLAECGEAADEIKGMEGKRAENPDLYTKEALAKEIIDVIFNLLRITRLYKIDLDEYFLNRIEGIKSKFVTLLKPEKIIVDKDENAIIDYWESQYLAKYSKGNVDSELKKLLLNNLDSKKGKILDHNCGEGYLKRFLEDNGWESYGTELSWNALAKASLISPNNLSRASVEKLPFEDDSFDAIISRRIIHSNPLSIRREAIQEVNRTLKRNGKFICIVQDIDDEYTLSKYKESGIELENDKNSFVVDLMVKGKRKQRMKHFYSKEDITREIEEGTNLKVESIQELTSKAGWCNDFQKYHFVIARKI